MVTGEIYDLDLGPSLFLSSPFMYTHHIYIYIYKYNIFYKDIETNGQLGSAGNEFFNKRWG